MRIAFIGLGSIAKRHIRNLKSILLERGYKFQIDVYRHTYGAEDPTRLGCKGRIPDEDIREAVSEAYMGIWPSEEQYDVAFITNPTALHYETVRRWVHNTKHMFIEKPVFNDIDADMEYLSLRQGAIYYVACPLRYTAVLQYVKDQIDLSKVYAVRAISSSYLPDWRPGTDYRNTYSARKDLGGGVAIDLVHEWDYLTYFFGFPQKILYAGGKISGLEIDSDDIASYIGIYPDKMIELHLDYFGRKAMREVELFLEEDTIRADLVNGCILYGRSARCVKLQEERDSYQKRELEHFLDILEGKEQNDNDVENALRVLRLALGENP